MRLEGTLDAFGLPDIFQLLSYTKKTGALHLRRGDAHGVVHLRDGAVTGARSDVRRQALGRRIVGTGNVDDQTLATAVARVQAEPACGLGRALADSGAVPPEVGRALAAEQATDAVFELLRWPDGEFAFVMGEPDPDDLGAALTVEEVVTEGRRRLAAWAAASVPPASAVLTPVPAPAEDPVLTRDEWALLSVVDGRRTVAEIVELSGRGPYAVVSALTRLVERGLLSPGDGAAGLDRRHELLRAAEGPPAARPVAPAAGPTVTAPVRAPADRPAPAPAAAPASAAPRVAPSAPAPAPAYARAAAPRPSLGVGDVHGSVAMQPSPAAEPEPAAEPVPAPHPDGDPALDRTLLLRLIAGVKGL
jgi:hypothetical protein